ncbi:FAD-binding oxidoreductase [Frigoribacterium sp. CFBP 13729]|uniref:FAD-binding oxidoreductase n=1 Tax=Frigoribacterium sp. CFBP 13729 TaxID=2775293 RepID=UPI00352D8559
MTDVQNKPQTTAADHGVAHMKWWGWGVEGVAFHHEDKPGFAPFVKKIVGVELTQGQHDTGLDFAQLTVPASRASAEVLDSLVQIVGPGHVDQGDHDRVVHTYGKSIRDLIRIRAGILERVPDLVVYPADEAEVQQIVDLAVASDVVLIPFGGGSNIVGSLEPMPTEERTVVSLDMGRLSKVLDIDEDGGLARIQAGGQGPDLEEQLNARGWTLGHFPDSFTHSTMGGWVATRSSGMQSDKYGDIADITKGLRVVRPGGVLAIRAVPSASTGPSLREMIIGSEGRLGVITEVTAQVHRLPEKREILAYLFPSWHDGLAAMQAIAESDARPSVTRVSDAHETAFSFATSKASTGISKVVNDALPKVLKAKGWDVDAMCLSFIGYEGSPEHVAQTQKAVAKIVKANKGMGVGKGPGKLYDQKKFDTPYLRDFFMDHGGAADVSETAAPWSKLRAVSSRVYAAANQAFDQIGVQGWIMGHLSHSYHSGACLYFTFAFEHGEQAEAEYDVVKHAIQQAFIDTGATVSHHHGVGLEHQPWLAQDVSPEGVAVMQGLFDSADPGRVFNPGKVTGA